MLLVVDNAEDLLDVDCVSSPGVDCVSVLSSGSELVVFWEALVDSLELQGAGESGLDCSIDLSSSSWAACLPCLAMR